MPRTNWELAMGPVGRSEALRFQFEMIKIRSSLGWNHKDLRMALSKAGLSFNPETGSISWQMADVQQWCRILGGRFLVTYEGLPTPNPDEWDAIVTNLRALFNQDEFERWMAVRILGQARLSLNVSAQEMGKKLNITPGAVTGWEHDTPNPMIAALMRHAYALGGTVSLGFVPVEPVKGPTGRKK